MKRLLALLLMLGACAEPEEMTWGEVAYEVGRLPCEEQIVECGKDGSVELCADHVRWHMCEPYSTCDMLVDVEAAEAAITVCRNAWFARRSGPDCNTWMGLYSLPAECDRVLALDPRLGWEE